MNVDDIKYRHCSVSGCSYKELRGSAEGKFVDGKFVCQAHALTLHKLITDIIEHGAAAAERTQDGFKLLDKKDGTRLVITDRSRQRVAISIGYKHEDDLLDGRTIIINPSQVRALALVLGKLALEKSGYPDEPDEQA